MTRDTKSKIWERVLIAWHELEKQLGEQGYTGPFIGNSSCIGNRVFQDMRKVVELQMEPVRQQVKNEEK